jgi:hypothetical protein
VRLFANSTDVGLDPAAAGGFYTVTSSVLTDGFKSMTTRFEDAAGNQSLASPTVTVTIDTIAPTVRLDPHVSVRHRAARAVLRVQ